VLIIYICLHSLCCTHRAISNNGKMVVSYTRNENKLHIYIIFIHIHVPCIVIHVAISTYMLNSCFCSGLGLLLQLCQYTATVIHAARWLC
jgi:hypothetical protein